jgi:hypothetical protein
MNGERAVLFATDPPYLVDYDGSNHPTRNKDWSQSYGVTWDDSSQGAELYDGFIAAAVAEAITEDAAWYCWHASRRQAMLEACWEKVGAFVHQQIIWVKDRGVLTRSHYLWKHEPCFMGWRRPNRPPKVAEQTLPDRRGCGTRCDVAGRSLRDPCLRRWRAAHGPRCAGREPGADGLLCCGLRWRDGRALGGGSGRRSTLRPGARDGPRRPARSADPHRHRGADRRRRRVDLPVWKAGARHGQCRGRAGPSGRLGPRGLGPDEARHGRVGPLDPRGLGGDQREYQRSPADRPRGGGRLRECDSEHVSGGDGGGEGAMVAPTTSINSSRAIRSGASPAGQPTGPAQPARATQSPGKQPPFPMAMWCKRARSNAGGWN